MLRAIASTWARGGAHTRMHARTHSQGLYTTRSSQTLLKEQENRDGRELVWCGARTAQYTARTAQYTARIAQYTARHIMGFAAPYRMHIAYGMVL